MTTKYVEKLINAYPSIKQIWLIGSRADGLVAPSSDWDYIVMANLNTLNGLSKSGDFDDPAMDLRVVYDGDQFRKPWTDAGRVTHGSLSSREWLGIGENKATYRATKPGGGDDFYVRTSLGKAVRIYPR